MSGRGGDGATRERDRLPHILGSNCNPSPPTALVSPRSWTAGAGAAVATPAERRAIIQRLASLQVCVATAPSEAAAAGYRRQVAALRAALTSGSRRRGGLPGVPVTLQPTGRVEAFPARQTSWAFASSPSLSCHAGRAPASPLTGAAAAADDDDDADDRVDGDHPLDTMGSRDGSCAADGYHGSSAALTPGSSTLSYVTALGRSPASVSAGQRTQHRTSTPAARSSAERRAQRQATQVNPSGGPAQLPNHTHTAQLTRHAPLRLGQRQRRPQPPASSGRGRAPDPAALTTSSGAEDHWPAAMAEAERTLRASVRAAVDVAVAEWWKLARTAAEVRVGRAATSCGSIDARDRCDPQCTPFDER
jgi:hypothetical protein